MKHNNSVLRFTKKWHPLKLLFMVTVCLMIAACTTPPPNNKLNVCHIFRQYPSWYWETAKVRQKWGLPISIQMAIMYQESRFNATAKPARTKVLWIIPWKRPTSATGYAQAVNSTWAHYKKETGNYNASRTIFSSSVDFIGWYAVRAHRRTGVPLNNARDLYLAYHEGIGGYSRRSYLQKPWLIKVAAKVQRNADNYRYQLLRCEKSLQTKPWWRFW